VTLSSSWALLLLLGIPVALWLGGRAHAQSRVPHPFWFLAESGRAELSASRREWRAVALLLVTLVALAVAAAGPVQEPAAVTRAPSRLSTEFLRAATEPRRGSIVVHVSANAPGRLTVWRGDTQLWRHDVLASGEVSLGQPYRGDGQERLQLVFAGAGERVETQLRIPSLLPRPVFLAPELAGTAVASALAVLPTVALVREPDGGAVRVAAVADERVAARADLLFAALRDGARPLGPVPLSAEPTGPLVGLTPALLSGLAVRALATAAPAGSAVWLRAGAWPAVFTAPSAQRPAVVVAVSPERGQEGLGVLLPVLLADLFAAAPLADADADDRGVAAEAAPVTAPGASAWPTRALLFVALAGALASCSRRAWRLRVAAAVLIIAALALGFGPLRRVVFIVDVSNSVRESSSTAATLREEIERRVDALGAGDRAAVVVFAATASVAVPMGEGTAVRAWVRQGMPTVDIDGSATRIATALAVARDVGGDARTQLVLLSDGYDTDEGLLAALGSERVELAPLDRGDTVELVAGLGPIDAVLGVPAAVPFEVHVDAGACQRRGVHLPLPAVLSAATRHGILLSRTQVELGAGTTSMSIPVTFVSPGEQEVHLVLVTRDDAFAANDSAVAVVRVMGQPRELWIADPAHVPASPGLLAATDVVVLDGVAPGELAGVRAQALADYVRRGGSVLVAGGPHVLAAGQAGALGALLPLTAGEASRQLAVVVVLDRSGSMDEQGGTEALASLIASLPDDSLLGVVAFDVGAQVLRDLLPVASSPRFALRVPSASGGTDPAGALARAESLLSAAPVGAQRVVVLASDGRFEHSAAAARAGVARLAEIGVRVAILGLGAVGPPQAALLASLGELGGGGLLAGGGSAALPRLVTHPAGGATPSGPPRARPAGVTLLGPDLAAALRNIRTSRYPARVSEGATVLADQGERPLCAARAVGAGVLVALATELRAMAPAGRARLGAALTAATRRQRSASVALRLASGRSVSRPRLRVDLLSTEADPTSSLSVEIEEPGGARAMRALAPLGDGRFEGELNTEAAGAFHLTAEQPTLAATTVLGPLETRGLGACEAMRAAPGSQQGPRAAPTRLLAYLCALATGLMLAAQARRASR